MHPSPLPVVPPSQPIRSFRRPSCPTTTCPVPLPAVPPPRTQLTTSMADLTHNGRPHSQTAVSTAYLHLHTWPWPIFVCARWLTYSHSRAVGRPVSLVLIFSYEGPTLSADLHPWLTCIHGQTASAADLLPCLTYVHGRSVPTVDLCPWPSCALRPICVHG